MILNNPSSYSLHTLCCAANGMLPHDVYQELFNCAQKADAGQIVEVGTAHGAATIAMSLGTMSSGRNCHIHTIDPFGGKFSSRSSFGDVATNVSIVKRNFERAGVSNCVSIFVGTSNDFYASGRVPEKISMLMLDADGRIDRDFLFFYDKMPKGAAIVIDDVDDVIALHKNQSGEVYIDQKFRISALLVQKFQELGLIEIKKKIVSTVFAETTGRKIEKETFISQSLECYRQLVSSVGHGQMWQDLHGWLVYEKYISPYFRFLCAIAGIRRRLRRGMNKLFFSE